MSGRERLKLYARIAGRALEQYYGRLLFALLIALILAGSYARVAEVYELQSYDWRFRLKPPPAISQDLVLVDIWDDSLESIGKWPFDRRYHAVLIEILRRYGAKVVGFDIVFPEPSPSDDLMAMAASQRGGVVLCEALDEPQSENGRVTARKVLTPLVEPFQKAAEAIAHVNAVADIDGTRRRVAPLIDCVGKTYVHMGVLLAAMYLDVAPEDIRRGPDGSVHIGDRRRIPVDWEGNVFVNYAGRWGEAFRHVSYLQILTSFRQVENGETPDVDLRELEGKVCLVGLTSAGSHDVGSIPIQALYPQVGVHASVFNNVVDGNFIQRAGNNVNLVILIVLLLLAILWAEFPRIRFGFLGAFLTWAGFVGLAVGLMAWRLRWIDLFYPALAYLVVYLTSLLHRSMMEKKKRKLMETELMIASKIQRSFLPASLPKTDLLEIAAFMEPAKHVGGDLYSALKIDD
ncbi:MAG: CHASE2 domain-containing protein [Candidatus Omnitrophica bacterium]|nr:CHASE2 domain-containing protein [Candidatus Omnitrophota bacterium]